MAKEKAEVKKVEVKTEVGKLTIDELASYCKRKGFVFRSSEIYGGMSGFWDFGPVGAELFRNIKDDFFRFFVQQKDNMTAIEASIISHPRTWKASGHIANFNVNDYLVACKKCKKSGKVDKPDLGKIKCPSCGGEYDWEHAKVVEQMFKTKIGTDQVEAYLRGETAQAMFMDFRQVQETSRKQLPFGIAQLGRCFRNEVAPRDFLFRCREFHIGEFEFFINPEDKTCDLLDVKHKNVKVRLLDAETQEKGGDKLKETTIGKMVQEGRMDEWHAYWLAEQLLWFTKLGLIEKIKVREHMKSELSHYSSATFDMDFEYPFGSKEIAGNANRGQYDLGQHMKESKESLELFDEKTKKKVTPRVIEPTFGIERVFLALLCNGYYYNKERENIVMKFPAYLAPVKVAVLPIVKDDKMTKVESVKKGTVTIRDRDTTKQIKVKISELSEIVRKVVKGESLLKLGKVVETRVK